MGSDLYMNPPKQIYDSFEVATEEEVAELLVGALANDRDFKVLVRAPTRSAGSAKYLVRVGTGRWT